MDWQWLQAFVRKNWNWSSKKRFYLWRFWGSFLLQLVIFLKLQTHLIYEYFSRKMLCYEFCWLLYRPEVNENTGNETENQNLFNSVWNYNLSKYTMYLQTVLNPFSNWIDSIPLTMKIFDISSLTVTNTSTFPWYAAYHTHKNLNNRNCRLYLDIF